MMTLTVPGRPYPQGSLRSFHTKGGATVTPQKPSVLVYRADIQRIWGDPNPWAGPIHIDIEFMFMRPKSHYNKSGLKPSAPKRHTQSPDIDKLARSVLDALTGYAYVDDKQVVLLHATKQWWHTYETVIRINEVGG
jgi:crossover junction endodeoxyribonuclease RusA